MAEIVPVLFAALTLPDFHPSAGQACAVFGFVIRHPDGAVMVDTGVGCGHPFIDASYHPRIRPLDEALAGAGIGRRDVTGVINTHLHFDHCGQNRSFPGVPIFVHAAEFEAARDPVYTVREWVEFPAADYRLVDGIREVAAGISVIPTPGHTPGHQSVLVESGGGRDLIVGQAAYTAAEYGEARAPDFSGLQDSWHREEYVKSLRGLHGLGAGRAFFSHDPTVWQAR